jgi:hypothetical protein
MRVRRPSNDRRGDRRAPTSGGAVRHRKSPRVRAPLDDDGPSRRALGLETIMRSGGEQGPNETGNTGRALGLARRAFLTLD